MTSERDLDERRRHTGCWVFAAVVVVLVMAFGIGLYVYNASLRRKFEAKVAALRAAGQPVSWREVLERRDNVPAGENSALIFLIAFEELDYVRHQHPDAIMPLLQRANQPGTRHSEQVMGIIRQHVGVSAEVLEVIHEAARLPGGVYPVKAEKHRTLTLVGYLDPLRRAARLCNWEAMLHADERDGEAAAESLRAGRRVAASLGDCWMLIEMLVRFATDKIVLDSVQRSLQLCEMPADSLRMLREELAKEEEGLTFEPACLGERASVYYWLAEVPIRELGGLFGEGGVGLQAQFVRYRLLPGLRAKEGLVYLDFMDRMLEVASMPPRKQLEGSRGLSREMEQMLERRGHRYPLLAAFMPAIARVFERGAATRVALQTARAALAAEEWRLTHGSWPESLQQLVPEYLDTVPEDPFSFDTIRYVTTDSGVLLYSIGPDGKDDGGLTLEEAQAGTGGPPPESWDLTFRLLNPALRGATQRSFHDEIMDSDVSLESLEDLGFSSDRLTELGFSAPELEQLLYR